MTGWSLSSRQEGGRELNHDGTMARQRHTNSKVCHGHHTRSVSVQCRRTKSYNNNKSNKRRASQSGAPVNATILRRTWCHVTMFKDGQTDKLIFLLEPSEAAMLCRVRWKCSSASPGCRKGQECPVCHLCRHCDPAPSNSVVESLPGFLTRVSFTVDRRRCVSWFPVTSSICRPGGTGETSSSWVWPGWRRTTEISTKGPEH